MSPTAIQNEFAYCTNRAAGLTVDAAGACRTAAKLPLPDSHRALLRRAQRGLDDAQDALFQASRLPWPQKPKPVQQLALL